jgi:hypothetical protein
MPVDFQEFLRQKTAGSDIRERNHNRAEWVGALRRLLDQIQDWLRAADPEGLLEVEPYEVQRAESRLGIYDAPALKIRLNTDEADLLPIGRYAFGPLSAVVHRALHGVAGTDGPAAGRVDITDGERRYMLFRDIKADPERWFAVDDQARVNPFDQAHLEAILQDLWS